MTGVMAGDSGRRRVTVGNTPMISLSCSHALKYVEVSTDYGHFLELTPELRPSAGNNLFVFALPE